MSGHTPGPWELDTETNDVWSKNAPDAGDIICEAPEEGCDMSRARWPANARLIAAAPEMYAVLLALQDAACPRPVAEAIRAALAKAEGRNPTTGA